MGARESYVLAEAMQERREPGASAEGDDAQAFGRVGVTIVGSWEAVF
jgi:hypothetical protein